MTLWSPVNILLFVCTQVRSELQEPNARLKYTALKREQLPLQEVTVLLHTLLPDLVRLCVDYVAADNRSIEVRT